jgi:hypothetical protein
MLAFVHIFPLVPLVSRPAFASDPILKCLSCRLQYLILNLSTKSSKRLQCNPFPAAGAEGGIP